MAWQAFKPRCKSSIAVVQENKMISPEAVRGLQKQLALSCVNVIMAAREKVTVLVFDCVDLLGAIFASNQGVRQR